MPSNWEKVGEYLQARVALKEFFVNTVRGPPTVDSLNLQEDAFAIRNMFLLKGDEPREERQEAQDKWHIRSITIAIGKSQYEYLILYAMRPICFHTQFRILAG